MTKPDTDIIPEPCQLYLVIEPGPGAIDRLQAALQVAPVASVLIAPRPGTKLGAGEVKPLVDLAQKANVAALLQDDARLARTLKADGVHVSASSDVLAAYDEARGILGQGGIVGVDAGNSRHDAMQAGEAGADYIAFGRPPADAEDYETREDLLAWWAEIFEIPCVGFDVSTAAEAAMLADTGAEFAALALPAGESLDDTIGRLRDIAAILTRQAPSAAGD